MHHGRSTGSLILILTGLSLACGRSSPSADAGAADANGDGGDSLPVDGDPDGATQSPRDMFVYPDFAEAAPPPDFGPAPAALPLPATVKPPVRLLQPGDQLAGNGVSACSSQEPASGDGHRWCVFHRKGSVAGSTELWVIDATKAAAGAPPPCDGTDPGCLRLTTTLWTGSTLGGPSHPYSHQFDGDTLIYYADAPAEQELHRGPVYAWRPGWTAGRLLTSADGVMCTGHAHRAVAHCMDAVAGPPTRPDSFELRAGSISTQAGGALPSVGRLRPHKTDGTPSWFARFNREGSLFAFSSPDPDPAIETLRVLETAQLGAGTPREILRDATGWAISNDDTRIFFMRDIAPEEPSLFAADFPTAKNVVKLGDKVGQYILVGNRATDLGVAFLSSISNLRTSFKLTPDSRMPASTLNVFTFRDFLEDVHVSPDQRFTGWLDGGFTARVVRHANLTSCKLNTYALTSAFEPLFLENAGLVFWNEDLPEDFDRRVAFYANPDGCQGTRLFARDIEYYQPVGDRGLVYTDEKDETDHVALKYAAATQAGGVWQLEPPVLIRDRIDSASLTLVGTESILLIFRVTETDPGTYVFGPLPL